MQLELQYSLQYIQYNFSIVCVGIFGINMDIYFDCYYSATILLEHFKFFLVQWNSPEEQIQFRFTSIPCFLPPPSVIYTQLFNSIQLKQNGPSSRWKGSKLQLWCFLSYALFSYTAETYQGCVQKHDCYLTTARKIITA